MKEKDRGLLGGASAEVFALIDMLHETEQRLEQLTAGEVDTVMARDGKTVLLRRAQEHLRHSDAAKQAAILNALPANIALLDAQGVIVSVNDAWRQFAGLNALQDQSVAIGGNYLWVCDQAVGDDAVGAQQAAAGIRAVLDGGKAHFSLEYPCHSPNEKRWFQMIVTPLVENHRRGVVVMHLNVTERRLAQDRIAYLNRIYATLSGINTLIVRVHQKDDLFRDACRIAVEAGGFHLALVALLDPATQQIVPVASSGKDAPLLRAIKTTLVTREFGPITMSARAILEKTTVISNEVFNDAQVMCNAQYTESGVQSIGVFPLIVADEAVGVFMLYASEIEFFKEEELTLLKELAGDIAFAIDHLQKQEQLDYLAYYDVLTGLANRTLFLERLRQYKRSAINGGYQLALVLIDLERFRNINDSLGRVAGDALLRQVAQWLTRKLGDVGLVARVGVDMFALVLPEVHEEATVTRFLDNALETFSAHPFLLSDAVFRIGFKAGAALFPQDAADAASLCQNAEAALKRAKASGDHYLYYTKKMAESIAGNLTLENQLREALDKGEFVLHYQPKVNLASGKVVGAEALIRWNDPRTGLVPPGRFIPILEETGLINEVGGWALRQALADYLRWYQHGLAAVRIAVNVSPLQLRNRGFFTEIRKLIGVHVHAPAGLELEITESLIMEDVKHSITCLQAIRAMGLSIAIDDFGTGFSSLSYLSKLPVDTLKIDRSFVIDMTAGSEGLALVSTIIGLAHALKLKVVAEGVETEEQMRLLRLLGCDEIQGFLFSKPVPREIFETKFLMTA